MARPRRKLHWVKFYIDPLLDGTTREELQPDERSIFYDLILMAGRANNDGWIVARIGTLPRLLNAPAELVDRAIKRCVEVGKIELDTDKVRVINFERYNPSGSDIERYDSPPQDADDSIKPSIIGNFADVKNGTRGEETQRRLDIEIEGPRTPPTPPNPFVADATKPPETIDPLFGLVYRGLEQIAGTLNSFQATEIQDIIQRHHSLTIPQFQEALRITGEAHPRKPIPYLGAVLDRLATGPPTPPTSEPKGFAGIRAYQAMTESQKKENADGRK